MGNRIALVATLALAACQPLHGGPAEHLHHLDPRPAPIVPIEPIAFVEDCNFDFHHRAPVTASRTAVQSAAQLDATADAQLAKAEHVAVVPARVDAVNDAIATYSRALAANPYDPDATLGLARAYDSVRRKGCALALLKRLGTLAEHSKFASAAAPVASSVSAHASWFREYRKEALSAVGQP